MSNKPLIHLIGVLVLLVVVTGAYGFWYSIVTAKSAEASSLAAQITAQSDATTKVAQAKSELTHLTAQSATMDQYFVSTSDVVPFLEQLQSAGTFLGSNVQVASVSATPGTPYGQLSLSLMITGSFPAVMRTIGSIEYSPYGTSITSLSLTTSTAPGTATSSSPQWTAAAVFSIGAKTGNVASTTTPITPAP